MTKSAKDRMFCYLIGVIVGMTIGVQFGLMIERSILLAHLYM